MSTMDQQKKRAFTGSQCRMWIALITAAGLTSGCVAKFCQEPEPATVACEEKKPQSTSQAQPPFAGETEVLTDTGTPHKQKDSPFETERISGKQLEEADATHTGQVLQDVPAIQPRR